MRKSSVDWESMEADWRAGQKSVLQLSEEHNVSRAAIIKHWGKLGIERDLSAKIHAMAESLVTLETVTQEVTQEAGVTEKTIVETNANMIAGVIIGQHKSVGRLRGVIETLYKQFEAELEDGESELPARVDIARKLSDTQKTCLELERKIFKLDAVPVDPVEAAARGAAQGAASGASEATQSMLSGIIEELRNAPPAA